MESCFSVMHGFEVNAASRGHTSGGIYLPLALLELQLALQIDRVTTTIMLTRLYVRMHINYREVCEMMKEFDEAGEGGRMMPFLASNINVSFAF